MCEVTAVVVTYNSSACIRNCVAACARLSIPMVIVDNGSADGTLAEIDAAPGVVVIANPTNRGFAAAVNQGIRAHSAALTLLLNPDVVLLDSIAPLTATSGLGRHTAVTGLLLDSSGSPQRSFQFRRFPSALLLAFDVLGVNWLWPGNPLNREYRYADLLLNDGVFVAQPAGALLMVRRDDWEELGGFDERFYPLWFEDVDYCKRFSEIGGKIVVRTLVRASHAGAHSVASLASGCRTQYWYVSLLRYAAKHFPAGQRRLVALAAMVGFVPRMFWAMASERSLQPLRLYNFLFRIAGRCLLTGEVAELQPFTG